jgi:hypothetical protein
MVREIAHRGINSVSCACQFNGGQATDARSGASDDDNFLLIHVDLPND